MRKSEIVKGGLYVEKTPSKHTDKLQKITVLDVKQHYELNKKTHIGHRNYTYVYYKTNEGQFYPAANSTDNRPLILDGLVGCILLSEFKKQFTPLN